MSTESDPKRSLAKGKSSVSLLAEAHGWSSPVQRKRDTISWRSSVPFLLLQFTPLLVLLVGWSPVAVLVATALYGLRMFAVTAFYHRYFSHRAFSTSRSMQFVFAILGNTSAQKGPLWWASHHRYHHSHSDRHVDLHSPRSHGILWSHIGWLISDLSRPTNLERVKDLARFPELRFLDRYYQIVPLLMIPLLYGLGALLQTQLPSLNTNGWQMVVWGFFVSTIALFHGTYTINSLAHRFGTRRFATKDDSRNNLWLALITLGEGWHNNHHRFPAAARQGLKWWEIDMTWYMLWAMSKLRLVHGLRPFPKSAYTPQS